MKWMDKLLAAARKRQENPERQPSQPKEGPRVNPEDPVEEASYESFPASDPPAYGSNRAREERERRERERETEKQ